MDEEDKKKLDAILKLSEENNHFLRKVRGAQKTSQMFKAIYWVIIIAVTLGGFYLVKPFLSTLTGLYSGIGGGSSNGSGSSSGFKVPDIRQLQDLLKQINPPSN
jgi:hypothetical protein